MNLVDRCFEYLSSKPMTLWGQAFDINDPERRRKAAEWLAKEVEAVAQQGASAG